jgi:hypothetical protein
MNFNKVIDKRDYSWVIKKGQSFSPEMKTTLIHHWLYQWMIMDSNGNKLEARHMNHLQAIEKLFQSKILKPEDFNANILRSMFAQLCGWKKNELLLDLLIKYIPRRYFTSSSDVDHGYDVLHEIVTSHSSIEQVDKYVKYFLEVSVDMRGADPLHECKYGCTILPMMISQSSSLLSYLFERGLTLKTHSHEGNKDTEEKEEKEWNIYNVRFEMEHPFREFYPSTFKVHNSSAYLNNPLFQLLDSYRFMKHFPTLEQIKKNVAILLKYGVDVNWSIPIVEYPQGKDAKEMKKELEAIKNVKSRQLRVKKLSDHIYIVEHGLHRYGKYEPVLIDTDLNTCLNFWDFIYGYQWYPILKTVIKDISLSPQVQFVESHLPKNLARVVQEYACTRICQELHHSREEQKRLNDDIQMLINEAGTFAFCKEEESVLAHVEKLRPLAKKIEQENNSISSVLHNEYFQLFGFNEFLFN